MITPESDNEIDDIIWSEIESSDSHGDFVCYAVHSPYRAKHLEHAKAVLESGKYLDNLTPVHYFKAVERIEKLAEKGDPSASFHMGKIYAIGIAVPQNLPKAVEWYEKAIVLGEPRAYSNLGWFYQSGYGVPRDEFKAFELLSFGAENGILSAKAAIGMMLMKGEGCSLNVQLGLQKLEESFYSGYMNAGNHISDMYFEGKLLPRDIGLAHDWLMKVADSGDERSMAILGHYLVTGSHGKTDTAKGLELLVKATQLQYLPAYLWLGTLYKKGYGIEQDAEKAIEWFKKGIQAGCRDCQIALNMMSIPDKDNPKSYH